MTKKENQVIAAKKVIKKCLLRGVNDETAAELVNAILAAEDDPSESEIKPGELVYAWDGDTKPIGPSIAFFVALRGNKCVVAFSPWLEDRASFDHIERFCVPFDWERWPNVQRVVDFDSTERFMLDSDRCPWGLEDRNIFGARVIRILKRPEGR